jgi:ATP-dependent Clp protease ATP-binding subunit ClpA
MEMISLEEVETLAREEARRFHHKYIRSEHLLLALLRYPDFALPIRYEDASLALSEMQCPTCEAEEKLIFAEGAKRAIAHAQDLAGSGKLSAEHILAGIVAYSPIARKLLLNRRDTEDTEKNKDE